MRPVGPRWFCAQTYRSSETKAELDLLAKGFEVCLPLCRERRVEHVGPLFPGYLFVRFDVAANGWWRVHYTKGIIGLIGSAADRPTPVQEGVVENLVSRMSSARIVDDPGHGAGIEVGEHVQVLEGPWVGWSGICTLASRDRVKLLLSVFGRETQAEFPRQAVVAA